MNYKVSKYAYPKKSLPLFIRALSHCAVHSVPLKISRQNYPVYNTITQMHLVYIYVIRTRTVTQKVALHFAGINLAFADLKPATILPPYCHHTATKKTLFETVYHAMCMYERYLGRIFIHVPFYIFIEKIG